VNASSVELDPAVARLLAGMPADPREAHDWLMASIGRLDEAAEILERAHAACDDPEQQEQILASGLKLEALRAALMEKDAELLLEVAPTPAFTELAHALRGQARADRQQWDAAARAHASRAPALVPVLLGRARAAGREARPRRREGQRSTGERSPPRRPSDPDDDDPPDLAPPAGAAA
jgi:hypothetical protein